MRVFIPAVLIAVSVVVGGCGSSYSGSPTSPSQTPTPVPPPTATPAPSTTGDVVTIDVVFENGAQSFSPNPATLASGQMVVWHNIDRVTHRVVLNNGSLDTGDLGPGASSRPMRINTSAPYHCSIHPSMVGTINVAAAETQSATGF